MKWNLSNEHKDALQMKNVVFIWKRWLYKMFPECDWGSALRKWKCGPFRPQTPGPAALSATEMRDKWRVCHGPLTSTPERSLSAHFPPTHTHRHTHWDAFRARVWVRQSPLRFDPSLCFCVNGQPLGSCLHFSLITGSNSTQGSQITHLRC